MPPSPRIKATMDEQRFTELCAELNVTCPTVEFKRGERAGKAAWGDYNRLTGHIRIFLGVSQYEYEALRFAQTECVRTLLHELRHHWQAIHHPEMWENVNLLERDAEGWAVENVARFKTLVRLSRTFPNSGFSRLGRNSHHVV